MRHCIDVRHSPRERGWYPGITMQCAAYQRWLGRFALWSLVVMLLVSSWPEVEFHNAASPDHPDATAHVHQGGGELWGDPEGMHVHACHCTAHCTALPVQTAHHIQPHRAPLVLAETPDIAVGVTSPPFRPPIA